MKKTQILSAIALAFALGVVAPIAVAENASAVTDSVKTAAEKDIENAKKSFGTVTLESGEKVDGWKRYAQADAEINNVNKVIADAKDAKSNTTATAGSISKTLMGAVNTAIGYNTTNAATLNDNTVLSDATKEAIKSAKWTAGTYDDVAKIAADIAADYNKVVTSSNSASANKDAAQKVVDKIKDALKAAQTSLDGVVAGATTEKTALINELQALTGDAVVTPATIDTVAKLNGLIAQVEAALPQMNRYRAVWTAQDNLDKALKADKTDDEIANLVAALSAAVAGTGNGTTVPGDKNDGVNAPATGIAGTAEGTATTVSIVAGLATALTALGAGVVAYRSARRK